MSALVERVVGATRDMGGCVTAGGLTRYVRRELEHLAKRAQIVRDNAGAIRRTQARVQGRSDRDTIWSVLHEGRGE